MHITLYPLDGPWEGRLAVAARPRGGDWLRSEVLAWRGSRINTVVSLLTPREAEQLDLRDEEDFCMLNEIDFVSFPIEDRGVPASNAAASALIRDLDSRLSRGENVLIHCRQGVGRPTLIAAGVLIYRGVDYKRAIKRVTDARGVLVPETNDQVEWLRGLGSSVNATHPAG